MDSAQLHVRAPLARTGLRNETPAERHDRNLVEMLQEVRVVQTGVQVLFAFLLTVPFSARFDAITSFQRGAYFTALVGAAAASVLLIAPTALHRVLFRLGQKQYMVDVSNRLTLGGLLSTAVAIDDLSREPRFAHDIAVEIGYEPDALSAAPIRVDDAVVGVLSVLDPGEPPPRGPAAVLEA